ncbi:CPBP family intramembrane metalloprotease [candidate division KSB1 bacterium]|nr:CPBP family intramembrane metalloprotease [candidate division KSB1 bacterium]
MKTRVNFKPGLYFATVFIISTFFYLAGAYTSFQDGDRGAHMIFLLPGLLTPFLVSLVLILSSKQSDYQKEYVNRLVSLKRIRLNMMPALLFLMPLAVLISIAISLLFGGSVEQFQISKEFSFSSGFMPVLLLLLIAATFEELGWRGYAFDSLQSRYTIFTASIFFGVLWSLWHLPLVFVKDSYQYEILHQNFAYALNFFAGIVPLGVITTWVWLKNRKSILIAILFHLLINLWNEVFALTQQTKCIESAVLVLFAVAIIIYDKKLFFSRKEILGRIDR